MLMGTSSHWLFWQLWWFGWRLVAAAVSQKVMDFINCLCCKVRVWVCILESEITVLMIAPLFLKIIMGEFLHLK